MMRNPSERELRNFDAVVFETPFSSRHVRLMKRLKSRVRLIVDLDDNYHRLDAGNPRYAVLTAQRSTIDAVIDTADELVVSGEPLREFYRSRCARVSVMPNMIPEHLFPCARNGGRGGRVRVGWHGGFSHAKDILTLKEVLPDIRRRFPDVQFIFFGDAPHIDGLDVEFVPSVLFDEFPVALANLRLDVGLAPLAATEFNRFKTNLKWLEYSALKIPVVASDFGPYADSIASGRDGFLAKSEEDWVRQLSALIEDGELRRSVGQRGYESAMKRYGCGVIGDRYAALAANWSRSASSCRAPSVAISASSPAEAGFNIPVWSVVAGILACTLASVAPLFFFVAKVRLGRAAETAVLACACVVVQVSSCLVVYGGICAALADGAGLADAGGLDPVAGLRDYFRYHRWISNLGREDAVSCWKSVLVMVIGALSLAGLLRERPPVSPVPTLFWIMMLESGILMFAYFASKSAVLHRRRSLLPALPLERFTVWRDLDSEL